MQHVTHEFRCVSTRANCLQLALFFSYTLFLGNLGAKLYYSLDRGNCQKQNTTISGNVVIEFFTMQILK